MKIIEVLETVLEGIAEDMIRDQQAKKMRASGKSAESFRIEMTEDTGELHAAAHWYWQINGRQPGPFKDGIQTMLEWIQDKGIKPRDEKTTLKQLAFLFARKIQEQGNDIFLGKRPGIDFVNIVLKWKQIGKEKIKELIKKQIKDEIYGAYNSNKT
jgi:hypothetical protein